METSITRSSAESGKRKELIALGDVLGAKEVETKLVEINPEYFMYLNL